MDDVQINDVTVTARHQALLNEVDGGIQCRLKDSIQT